uniref:Uncharacterized protein n=1 Tax=Alexandrium catenella TaxID=2925 RepID=A0A7S1S583_ALECA|mmetsp:Transcript_86629/g.230125  ORF Transcript_86629/g.230125 Transcript_86629/m.230125 type:complete len:224 (+) Transcript_86629:84-755(+)
MAILLVGAVLWGATLGTAGAGTVGFEVGARLDEALEQTRRGVAAGAQVKLLQNRIGDSARAKTWGDYALSHFSSARDLGQAALSAVDTLLRDGCLSSGAYELLLTLKPAIEGSLLPTVAMNVKIVRTWIDDVAVGALIGTTEADIALMRELAFGGVAQNRVGRFDVKRALGGALPCGLGHGTNPLFEPLPQECAGPFVKFAEMPELFLADTSYSVCRRYSYSM